MSEEVTTKKVSVDLPEHGTFKVSFYETEDGSEYFIIFLQGFNVLGPYATEMFNGSIEKVVKLILGAYVDGHKEGEHSGFDKAISTLKNASRDWDTTLLGE